MTPQKCIESESYRPRIQTTPVYPPIPIRTMDWSAQTENYEPGDPIGWGCTEQEAIESLIKQLEELE